MMISGVFVFGLTAEHNLQAAEVGVSRQSVEDVSPQEVATGEHRLLITARPGELQSTHVQANGLRLFVTLSATADLEQWRAKARALLAQPSIFHKAYVQTIGERNHLVVEFMRPVDLIDETVALNGDSRLSWELLLRERPVDSSLQLLEQIKVEQRGNLYDLSFSGHSELIVEVSLVDQSRKLVVELPGVAKNAVKLPAMPEFLGTPQVESRAGGGSVLIFTPAMPIDLLDAQIGSDDAAAKSVIHLILVPDAAVQQEAAVPASLQMTQLRSGFGLEVAGPESVEARGYYLTAPSRLVVDFPGTPAEAVSDLVSGFAADERFIQSVRYGASGLGSARVELTLNTAYADGLARTVTPFIDRHAGALTVVMPQAAIQPQEGFPDELKGIAGFELDTLRHVAAFDFTSQPVLSIGSVTLDDKHYASVADVPAGERYRLLDLVDEALRQDPTYLAAKAEFRRAARCCHRPGRIISPSSASVTSIPASGRPSTSPAPSRPAITMCPATTLP
ncbi:hypothetical protein BFR47_04020 [Oceanisphaera psychrotolerans]|uniref:AMIN domain-containing protein n=1 Tax=Oceanisphaera psychrotolerans TaxID=1414654 RepID=A0A1J4QAC8_9GAMM|nr:hypothetical protein BFR47_04020 [Oceanisphaera psychrotolerans]